ncbi:hypothetical protein GC167_00870 [bacterium]|nr:hypothetical protein [bacterium]
MGLRGRHGGGGASGFDEHTGQYYYGARYQDPLLGIWLSPDPLFFARPSLTPYNFVQNNPIMQMDPTGLLDNGGGEGDPEPIYSCELDEITVTAERPAFPMKDMWTSEDNPKVPGVSFEQWQFQNPNYAGLSYSEANQKYEASGDKARFDASWDQQAKAERDREVVERLSLYVAYVEMISVVSTAGAGNVAAGRIKFGSANRRFEIGPRTETTTFNNPDELIQAAGLLGKKKIGTVQGNRDRIFQCIAKGGSRTKNGAYRMPGGTVVHLHSSRTTGLPTITVDRGVGKIIKIRIGKR